MNNNKKINDPISLYKPTKFRFYILFTFSLFSFLSGFLWNAWQPIMRSFNEIYKWNLTQINLLSFIPGIVFCIFIIPFTFVWNRFGIQFVYHISACLFVIGTFIRLYPGTIYLQSILIQVGSFITSFGALLSITGAPVISSIWFPSRERGRATATAISCNTLGSAFAPLISSYIVPDVNYNNKSINFYLNSSPRIESGIQKYLFLQFSLAIFCLTLILIYFPEKPKYLPCRSSEKSLRIDYWDGFRSLFKNRQFAIVFILNFITFGVNSGVGAVFTSFILPLGLTQKDIALLNTVSSLVTFVSGILGGWLGDHIKYKKIIMITVLPSVAMYIILGFQILRMIPYDIISIYLVNVILAFVSTIVCPISFEMGCEAAFPVSEEVSTAVLGFATNLGIAMFIAVTMIPNIGTIWIPFSYATLVFLLLPLMWFYEDRSKRKEYDMKGNEDILNQGVINETSEYSVNCPLLVED